jgi:multiple sugar transport system substrate-binding protein
MRQRQRQRQRQRSENSRLERRIGFWRLCRREAGRLGGVQQHGKLPEPEATLKLPRLAFEAAKRASTSSSLSVTASDDDYHTKMQLQLQAGNDVADVMYYSPRGSTRRSSWISRSSRRVVGGVARLDGAVPRGCQDRFRVRGRQDIPGAVVRERHRIWYNKAVFEKAGLPVPWEPKSWADMTTAAETIKANVPGAIPMHLYAGRRRDHGRDPQDLPASDVRHRRRPLRHVDAEVAARWTGLP